MMHRMRGARRGNLGAVVLAALALGSASCSGHGAAGERSSGGAGVSNAVAPTTASVLPNGDSVTQEGPVGQKFRIQADGVVLEATVRELVSLGAPPPEWKDPAGDFLGDAKWHGVAWRAAIVVKWVSGDVPPTRLITLFGWEAGTAKHADVRDAQHYTTMLTGVQSLDDQGIGMVLGSLRVGQEATGYVYYDVDKDPITTLYATHSAGSERPPLAVWKVS